MNLSSEFLSQGFFGFIDSAVPAHLEPVSSQNGFFIGSMLFLSLLLFALSRAIETNYIRSIIVGFVGLSTTVQLQKSDTRLASLSSLLLILAYLITNWACWTLLIFSTFNWQINDAIFTGGIVVLFFTFYPVLGIAFTSWVTGEWNQIKDLFLQHLVGIQAVSIIYFSIALIWFLNPSFRVELFYTFVIISLIHLAIRWIKGIIVSFLKGIPLYYIILYFCTLEILPIFVAYYIITKNFNF